MQRRKVEVPVFPMCGKYTRRHAIWATGDTHTHDNTHRAARTVCPRMPHYDSWQRLKECVESSCRPVTVCLSSVTQTQHDDSDITAPMGVCVYTGLAPKRWDWLLGYGCYVYFSWPAHLRQCRQEQRWEFSSVKCQGSTDR